MAETLSEIPEMTSRIAVGAHWVDHPGWTDEIAWGPR
jgi:hypothetical protein